MKPLYIFDLDGTLALIDHRRHLVSGETKNWPAFFAACVDDAPNWPVIRTLQNLSLVGGDIWIWSGRSDAVKMQTLDWLDRHNVLTAAVRMIRMRPSADHRPDEQLKAQWLAELTEFDRQRLVAIFEDRDRMVKLWRDNGIACFQVAPGAF